MNIYCAEKDFNVKEISGMMNNKLKITLRENRKGVFYEY